MSEVRRRFVPFEVATLIKRDHPRRAVLSAGHRLSAREATPTSGIAWAKSYRAKLRTTDTLIVLAAVILAFTVRFGAESGAVLRGSETDYWAVSIVIVMVWLASLSIYRTRDARAIGTGATEYKRVATASTLTFGALAIAFVIFKVDIARGYFILALPVGMTGLVGSRWLWRKWLTRQRLFDHYLSRALVVGSLDDVQYVVGQIQQKSGAAYSVVGAAVADDDVDLVRVGRSEVPVVCDLAGIADAASRFHVDTVIIAGQPGGGSQFIRRLSWALEGTATDLVLASRLTDVAGPRIHFRPIEGLPLIQVEIPQFEGGKHVLKRVLDAAASGFGLLILLPVLIVIAVLIKLDSPGPVIFRQERVGRNGDTFRMLKFRSMVKTAEVDLARLAEHNEGSGPLFKLKDDPRVTRVGRTLRKYSLDELPQLWNVLVGEMSLVGPRPPLACEVQCYENDVHRRLYIKPGLTGMWQVNGRSDLSWDESVRLDLYYVENWSLAGDLMIIWRTFKVLLHPIGAY